MDLTSNATNAAAAFDKAMNDFSSYGLLDLEDALVRNSLSPYSSMLEIQQCIRHICNSLANMSAS